MGGLLAKDTMTKASWIISKVIHKAQSSKVPLLHPQAATPPLFHTQQQPLHCPEAPLTRGIPLTRSRNQLLSPRSCTSFRPSEPAPSPTSQTAGDMKYTVDTVNSGRTQGHRR